MVGSISGSVPYSYFNQLQDISAPDSPDAPVTAPAAPAADDADSDAAAPTASSVLELSPEVLALLQGDTSSSDILPGLVSGANSASTDPTTNLLMTTNKASLYQVAYAAAAHKNLSSLNNTDPLQKIINHTS